MSKTGEITTVVGKSAMLLFLVTSVLSAIGCGGGSTGTGDGGRPKSGAEIKGTITNDDNEPVEGAIIQLTQTGETTQSDAQGHFSIKSTFVGKQAVLAIAKNEISGRIEIAEDLTSESVVTLQISLLKESKLVVASQTITLRTDDTDPPTSILPPRQTATPTLGIDPDTVQTPILTPTPGNLLKSIFRGTIRYSIGSPVVGAKVTISESRDSTITDQSGYFSLERPTKAGEATLIAEIYGVPLKVELNNIPERSIYYTMELVVEFPDSRQPSTISEFEPRILLGETKVRRRMTAEP